MQELAPTAGGELAPQLDMPRVRRASRAESTWRRYQSAWHQFTLYCERNGFAAMPALSSTVAAFLAWYAGQGRAWASVTLARAAIAKAHKVASQPDPTLHADVTDTLDAVARTIGTAPRRQAEPVTREQMQAILATLPLGACYNDNPNMPDLRAVRDRALLAVWWLSACRSDEMASLDLGDVSWRTEGAVLQIRRSKTDQKGKGHSVPIPEGVATAALLEWRARLSEYGKTAGPLWRSLDGSDQRLSPEAIAAVLVRRAAAAGVTGLTGHSVRAGHVTQAALDGKPLQAIAEQTGHKSLAMVLRYVRRANLFKDTSANGLL